MSTRAAVTLRLYLPPVFIFGLPFAQAYAVRSFGVAPSLCMKPGLNLYRHLCVTGFMNRGLGCPPAVLTDPESGLDGLGAVSRQGGVHVRPVQVCAFR